MIELYSTTSLERQIVIKTAGGGYAVSPQNLDRFVDRLSSQLGTMSAEVVEVPEASPMMAGQALLADRPARWLLAIGGLFNLAILFFLSARLSGLPYRVPFRFGPDGEVLLVGSPRQLLAVAGIGTLLWAINGVLGAVLYQRLEERMAAYLLWGGAIVLQLLLAGALWTLVGT
jgi:hypothetical protein